MTTYRTRAAAITDARIGIWGDRPFAQREQIVPAPTVTANVNGTDVAIHFDNYGRVSPLGVTLTNGRHR